MVMGIIEKIYKVFWVNNENEDVWWGLKMMCESGLERNYVKDGKYKIL